MILLMYIKMITSHFYLLLLLQG